MNIAAGLQGTFRNVCHDMTGLALHADFEWFYLGEPQEDET